MNLVWWSLPGPDRFVSEIEDSLRHGRNAVVLLPKYCPEGLSVAVRAKLADSDWTFSTFVPPSDELPPLRKLADRFLDDTSRQLVSTPNDLLNEDSFLGKIIWSEVSQLNGSLNWVPFISSYQAACKQRSPMKRSMICLCLSSHLTDVLPQADTCLDVFRWNDYVHPLDMLLYTSLKVEDQFQSDLHRAVGINVIAKLAMWDPLVVDCLSSKSLEEILDPGKTFEVMASDRNWLTPGLGNSFTNWASGKTHLFQEKEERHSAILSVHGPKDLLDHRMWSAQVGVIFPFIEECRRSMINGGRLNSLVPFQTDEKKVYSDVRDMEIGLIAQAFQRTRNFFDPELKKLAYRLRDMRNDLAHLEGVKTKHLMSMEVQEYRRILDAS